MRKLSLGIGLSLCLALNAASAEPPHDSSAIKSQSAGILIIGDTGYIPPKKERSGLIVVSDAMKSYCVEHKCDFAAMTGDNIYPKGADGLAENSKDAEIFRRVFEEPYGDMAALSEDFRIYMTLGNHDWGTSRAGALAQVEYAEKTKPFYMDGLFYTVKPPAGNGDIELFIVDTEMLLSVRQGANYSISNTGEPVQKGDKLSNGASRKAKPVTAEEHVQLQWLENAMKASNAKWKIVVAHHPLWESGGNKHKQAVMLRDFLRPVICANADVYLAGHQHTLEVHEDSCENLRPADKSAPLLHIVSGAGSKSRSVNSGYTAWQKARFPDLKTHYAIGDAWGFIYANIDDDDLELAVISAPERTHESSEYTETFRYKFSK